MPETLEEFLARVRGPLLVSACLVGLPTRYDGTGSRNDPLVAFAKDHSVVPVCPEQLGGLPTPRPRAALEGGDGAAAVAGSARVVNDAGRDVTENFLAGARATAAVLGMVGARFAALKDKSPSCGVCRTYVNGRPVKGCGVTTAVLKTLGVDVFAVD